MTSSTCWFAHVKQQGLSSTHMSRNVLKSAACCCMLLTSAVHRPKVQGLATSPNRIIPRSRVHRFQTCSVIPTWRFEVYWGPPSHMTRSIFSNPTPGFGCLSFELLRYRIIAPSCIGPAGRINGRPYLNSRTSDQVCFLVVQAPKSL